MARHHYNSVFCRPSEEDAAAATVLRQVPKSATLVTLELPTRGCAKAFTREDGVRIVVRYLAMPANGEDLHYRGDADVAWEDL
jgi:hypothetical protein